MNKSTINFNVRDIFVKIICYFRKSSPTPVVTTPAPKSQIQKDLEFGNLIREQLENAQHSRECLDILKDIKDHKTNPYSAGLVRMVLEKAIKISSKPEDIYWTTEQMASYAIIDQILWAMAEKKYDSIFTNPDNLRLIETKFAATQYLKGAPGGAQAAKTALLNRIQGLVQ